MSRYTEGDWDDENAEFKAAAWNRNAQLALKGKRGQKGPPGTPGGPDGPPGEAADRVRYAPSAPTSAVPRYTQKRRRSGRGAAWPSMDG